MAMPKYTITCDVTATVRETWLIEAENEQTALDRFVEAPDGQEAEFVGQDVTGDEENRMIIGIALADPEPALHNGPYSPELAEAFRLGARELCNSEIGDKIDVPADAAVEECPGGGGVYVTVRLFVSDAERSALAGEEETPCPACDGKGAFLDTGLDCAACFGGGVVIPATWQAKHSPSRI